MKVNYAGQIVPDDAEYGGRPEHSGKATARENRLKALERARAARKDIRDKRIAAEKARKAGVLTTARIFSS